MEPRRAGTGESGPFLSWLQGGKRQALHAGSLQRGDCRRLELPRRVRPQGRRGQKAVLVIGRSLLMLVPVDEGLRKTGQFRGVPGRASLVLMMGKGMRSQPQQLRQRGSSEEEESGGKAAVSRHAGIVQHPAVGVNRIDPCSVRRGAVSPLHS